MQQPCPYCGNETSALKNHVRLTAGDGHGPGGTYPDDFEDGTTPDPTPPLVDDAEGRESGADAGEEDPSSEEGVTPSSEAEASHSSSQAAVDAPNGDGSESAVSDTRHVPPERTADATDGGENPLTKRSTNETTDDPPETESGESVLTEGPDMDTEQQDTDGPLSDVDGCPDCGAELVDFRSTNEYQGHPTPADLYCSKCGRGFNHPETPGGSSGTSSGSGWFGAAVIGATLGLGALVFGATKSDDGNDEIGVF